MIPPNKEARLRSIVAWLKYNPELKAKPQAELLLRMAQENDALMMETFGELEDMETSRILDWQSVRFGLAPPT